MNLKKAKLLIPVLAVLVILESVFIINQIEDKSVSIKEEVKKKITSFPRGGENGGTSAVVSLQGEEGVKVGEENIIDVVLIPKEKINLDGVDVYLKYNPEAVEIVGIDPCDNFSYVAKKWIQPEEQRIILSMVETEKIEGISFSSGSKNILAKVEYKALSPGETKIEVYHPDKRKGTVLAGQGQEYDFSKQGLSLKIE